MPGNTTLRPFTYDSYNLIAQANLDGGDTAGREFDYWFAKALGASVPERTLTFEQVVSILQVSPGVFIRNPKQNPVEDPAKSWNDPTDFSRDQTIPLILALGENKDYTTLHKLFNNQIKRFTLYQNYDLASPEDFNYYIRAFDAWYFYPVLLVGDLIMLGNSIVRCIEGTDEDTSDDINHTLALIQAQKHLATPLSWLARKIYKTFRLHGVQSAWNNYFSETSGANPFNEIYSTLISDM